MKFCDIIEGLLNGKKYRLPFWGNKYIAVGFYRDVTLFCLNERGYYLGAQDYKMNVYELSAAEWEEFNHDLPVYERYYEDLKVNK